MIPSSIITDITAVTGHIIPTVTMEVIMAGIMAGTTAIIHTSATHTLTTTTIRTDSTMPAVHNTEEEKDRAISPQTGTTGFL